MTGRRHRAETYRDRYAVRLTVADGRTVSIRPCFDTHYVSGTLYELG